MSQIRISLSKTNYSTAYAATQVDTPFGDYVRVFFNPSVYPNFEKGQKISLVKPANPDWNSEYYILEASNPGGGTMLKLRFPGGENIRQSFPALPITGTVYTHSYNWNIFNDIVFNGKIKYEREKDVIFGRKKLSQEISFKKESYAFIDELRKVCYPYLIYIRIERLCNGVWKEEYIGAFTVSDMKFSKSVCQAKVQPFTFDDYYRTFELYKDKFNIMEINPAARYNAGFPGVPNAFGNRWIKLPELFDYFIKKSMPNVKSIVSNFFNINPNGYVYSAPVDNSKLGNVMIQAMSDGNKPSATNPATECKMSLQELFEALRVYFNVYWAIIDRVLYIENEIFFDSAVGINIIDKILNPKDFYEYDNQKIVRKETFKSGQGYDTDFSESSIIYNSQMLNNQKGGGEDVTYDAGNFTTDLGWVYNVANGAPIAQVPSSLGVELGAFKTVLSGAGDYQPDVNLTWDYMISLFHQYKRPDIEGYYYQTTADKVYKLFQSKMKTILRDGITIKHCCNESPIDLNELVITEWGEAEIVEAEEDLFTDTLKLKLLLESC